MQIHMWFFSHSESGRRELEKIQKEKDPNCEPVVTQQDVDVRWNSIHDMFDRMLHLKSFLPEVLNYKDTLIIYIKN